ncbi:MAG: ArsR/SmtB family transcription factor [Lachnospirales bacterium]
MTDKYVKYVGIVKAISDVNRMMILEMLSCGELCGCEILEKFNITQPTLSHHMKILCTCNLVDCRKAGKNMMYTLNQNTIDDLELFLHNILTNTDDCICK